MSLQAPRFSRLAGAPCRVGLVAALYNTALVDALLAQATGALRAAGVKSRNLEVLRVPGSGELPSAARGLALRMKPDAVLALGVIIRGDTIHFELLAQAVAHALQQVALETGAPVINGVVVAGTLAQARARCVGKIDRGGEFGRAALAMAALKRKGWR